MKHYYIDRHEGAIALFYHEGEQLRVFVRQYAYSDEPFARNVAKLKNQQERDNRRFNG